MKSRTLVYVYLGVILAYLATVLFFPLDPEALKRYELTASQLRIAGLGLAIPMIAIWLISLYGFLKFRAYSHAIAKESEGEAYTKLVNGLMVLSFSLPLASLLSSVLNYFALQNTNLESAAIIIRNYSSLLYQFVAFYLLAQGASGLVDTLKPKVKILHTRWAMGAIILFSSLFTWVITARPFGGSIEETYHMPGLLILLTLVMPYLLTWYVGAMAVYRLNIYHKKVRGELYKKILIRLVMGISTIITLSIVIQILVALSERLTRLNLTPILLLIYLLLIGYVVGFGLVAQGARQLQKIEEV